jgi:hypothetical protein
MRDTASDAPRPDESAGLDGHQPTNATTVHGGLHNPRIERGIIGGMALDERALFTEKSEARQGRYQCPKCRRTNEYTIRWVRRSKRDRLPAGADDGDKAKFSKLRDYLLRLDDEVTCKTCGKKFEIPSQHSLMFVDQLAGLPNEADLEREISLAAGEPEPAPESKPTLPPRFTRKPSGWK